MENKPNKRLTGVRLDPDLRRQVGHKVLERKYVDPGFTFGAAVHEALELWVAEKPKSVKVRGQDESTPFREVNGPWHLFLEAILNLGGMDEKAAVKTMLTALVKPYIGNQKKGKAG